MGFAKIAIEAKVPVIPVFTQNVREAFRTVGLFRYKKWRHVKYCGLTSPKNIKKGVHT